MNVVCLYMQQEGIDYLIFSTELYCVTYRTVLMIIAMVMTEAFDNVCYVQISRQQ